MTQAALFPLAVTPRQLLESIGVHSQPLVVLCTAIVLAGALATGLFGIHRLARAFGRQLAARRREERRRLLRRRLFASFVESRVRDLDNKEEWSDQRFAELEAEVETIGVREGRGLLGPFRRGGGLRRERSLSRALVKSKEKLILLQGDPGSGKSVALRFVARRMAERAMGARTNNSLIPLYLNLKNLKPGGGEVNAKLIENYVLEALQTDGNRDIHRFLREEFKRGKEDGTWFFLFDSFDEIPDVLSATEVTDVVQAYSDAIYSFLHDMNRCRGIIASRHFRAPPRWGMPTFRIVPLSERRKRELIRKADSGEPVESQLLSELPAANADVVSLSSNPLFLGLLVEYAQREKQLPTGWHDVFEAFVSHRLKTDDRKVAEIFGIGAEELRLRSEELAFTMTATEGLGLSPARGALEEAYVEAGFTKVDRLAVALDALEWIKLGRSEGGDRSSSPTFSFAHRRFQEYFATCVVLREPDRVSPRRLLTDASWRETTVTLCHTYSDRTGGILTEADALLSEAVARQSGDTEHFTWPPGVLHLLSLLQNAFAGRTEALPDSVHRRVEEIFRDVDARGTILDRKWVLEVAGIARPNDLARRLGIAFRDGSDWLREVAYRQTARLASVSAELEAEIRVALVERTADLRLQRDWAAARAQLMRLDSSPRLMQVARLLRAMPLIDSAAVLLGLIGILAVQRFGPLEAIAAGVLAGLFAAAYFPAAERLAKGRFRQEPMGQDGRLIPAEVVTLAAFLARATAPLWASSLVVPAGSAFSLVLVLAFVYAMTWSIAATHACVYGPPRHAVGWLAVHLSPVRRRYKSLRDFLSAVTGLLADLRDPFLLGIMFCAAVFFASLFVLPERVLMIESVLVGVAFLGAVAYLFFRWMARAIPDALWRRRWKDAAVKEVRPRDILDVLVELRQASTVAWYLEEVRTQRLLLDSDEARAVLRDVLRVLDLGNGWSLSPRSRGFAEWYDANGKQASLALRRVHDEGVPDELGRLLEELERRRELPVA